MEAIAQFFSFLGYWESLGVATCSVIGVWLLTSGREWFKREQKFLLNTSLIDGPASIPLIGNALTFACNYDNVLNRIVELSDPKEEE